MSPKIPNPLGLEWYQHPSLILQLSGLSTARDDLRQKNLFEHEDIRPAEDLPEAPEEAGGRTGLTRGGPDGRLRGA